MHFVPPTLLPKRLVCKSCRKLLICIIQTLLNLTLRDLLQILNHEDSYTDATISSTLHCLEILMSDNTLYVSTLKYAPEAILQCVRHFKNQNWVVR